MSNEKRSHEAHSEWYDKQYASAEAKDQAIANWEYDQQHQTINHWIHHRQLSLADPFTVEPKSWLTIGDGYGFDANYFYKKGLDVTATDISGSFLPLSQSRGFLEKFSIENVEKLSFADESFDYVFCKEAYHHFPRPYLGVYEMIRVAREAVILIEPHDPISKMPFLLGLRNIFDRFDTRLLQKYWKNRYSFEEVGNYVFKLSEREMDKLANGMGLPMVAFKGINNNYYHPSYAREKADDSSAAFRNLKKKLGRHDLLSKMSLMPYQILCAVIFKRTPSEKVMQEMRAAGFQIHVFPPNPYAR